LRIFGALTAEETAEVLGVWKPGCSASFALNEGHMTLPHGLMAPTVTQLAPALTPDVPIKTDGQPTPENRLVLTPRTIVPIPSAKPKDTPAALVSPKIVIPSIWTFLAVGRKTPWALDTSVNTEADAIRMCPFRMVTPNPKPEIA